MDEAMADQCCDAVDSAWRRLERAADDRTHPLSLMAFTTVSPLGRPVARYLVLRGASRTQRRLWFHTDRRSNKARHLRTCPFCCAVGYDPRDRSQIQVHGAATIHEHDSLARRHWEQTDLATLQSFGVALEDETERPGTGQHAPVEPASSGRANFAVIQMQVLAIDLMELAGRSSRHSHLTFRREWVADFR